MEPEVQPGASCSSRDPAETGSAASAECLSAADALVEPPDSAGAVLSRAQPSSVVTGAAELSPVEHAARVADVTDEPEAASSGEEAPTAAVAADVEPSSSNLGVNSASGPDAAFIIVDRPEAAATLEKPPDAAKTVVVEPSSWDLGPDSAAAQQEEGWTAEGWADAHRKCDDADWALGSEALLAKEKIFARISCEAEALQRKRADSEQNKRLEKICEAYEWQTFSLGPFQDCNIEILEATYGVPDVPEKRVDVTQQVLLKWAEQSNGGLKLKGFNTLFGDPAPWDVRKKLTVRYRLSHTRGDVRAWDVSHGQYAEGIAGQGSRIAVTSVKVVSNLVGVTMAAAGYTAGMLSTGVTRQISKNDAHVVDSVFSRMGFQSWLLSNGIFPNLTFDPLEEAGEALESFYAEAGLETSRDGPLQAEDLKMTPLIVSNHISYLDGMVLAHALECPRIIAAAGTTNTPFVGKFAEELVIEVDRNDADSRTKTLEAIRAHVTGWTPGGRPLLVFPEGTTSNGDELLEFRRGAFVSARPVRPVVVFYTGAWHPANTNFRETSQGEIQPTGDTEWYGQFFGHLTHTLQVKVMKPYVPSLEEREDPLLFARNVREVMSEAYAVLRREHAKSKAEQERNLSARAADLPQRLFGQTDVWGQCGRNRKAEAPNRSRSVPPSRSPFSPCEDPSG